MGDDRAMVDSTHVIFAAVPGAVAALNVVTLPQRMTVDALRRDLLPLGQGAVRELCPLL